MLYPLSYEGVRLISYRPGDIHECPGVPPGANRCHWVRRWRFRRWSEDTRSKFRAHAARPAQWLQRVPSADLGCYPLPERIRGIRGVP
jgi:hypothetical protein